MCSGLCKLVFEQRLERCGSTSIPPRVDSGNTRLAIDVDFDVPVSSTLVADKPDLRAWENSSEDTIRLASAVKPSNSNRAVAPFVCVRWYEPLVQNAASPGIRSQPCEYKTECTPGHRSAQCFLINTMHTSGVIVLDDNHVSRELECHCRVRISNNRRPMQEAKMRHIRCVTVTPSPSVVAHSRRLRPSTESTNEIPMLIKICPHDFEQLRVTWQASELSARCRLSHVTPAISWHLTALWPTANQRKYGGN